MRCQKIKGAPHAMAATMWAWGRQHLLMSLDISIVCFRGHFVLFWSRPSMSIFRMEEDDPDPVQDASDRLFKRCCSRRKPVMHLMCSCCAFSILALSSGSLTFPHRSVNSAQVVHLASLWVGQNGKSTLENTKA